MLTASQGLLLAVATAEFLIGLVGNGILVCWSLHNWYKYRTTSLYSLIVLGLATCRFHLQLLILIDLISYSYFLEASWIYYLNICWVFLSQANLCLATCLSVFYCIKITNFVHPAFTWLKQRAVGFGFCFLLGSLLATLLLVPILGYNKIPKNSTLSLFIGQHYFHMLWLNMGSLVPFTVFLFSSGMLIISLDRHHKRMRHHMEGRKDAQTMAHVAALKSLISFLLLYVIYFLATPLSIVSKFPPVKLTEVLISEIFMAAYPSFHSIILIVGNPRMKQQFQRILWKIVCLWKSQQM
ncbi:taste receptor type 2 member 5 [Dromiciops gliroides]|uniref:taste receptor type 2 member 5 n=1 Tax=Dromiciops gliroides TaxID=33562 RepID=UPI001CC6FAF5|nr:taste receptor type 2 member 5 [Dromiciops gliroides]